MRNLPIFSGIVLFALLKPDFSVIHFPDQSSLTQRIADIESLVAIDTLLFCVDYGNAELPPNNQTFLGEGHPDASSCSVHIWTTQEVTDPCGGSMTYSVRIYPFSGVDAIQVIDSREVQLDINQHATLSFDTRDNSLPADHPIRTSGLAYTSRNCDGVPGVDVYHLMEWTISNACGDTSIITSYLGVDDCHKPKPSCVGLSSVVMPSSRVLTIWAKDFENQSIDDCTKEEDLLYSFNKEFYEPSRVFDCTSIEANGSPSFLVEIWIADEGRDLNCNGFIQPLGIEWSERNKDSCTTLIVIDDNENVCDSSGSSITRITTPGGVGIANVSIDFVHNGNVLYHMLTDDDGYYDISHFINPLFHYDVVPHKNDDAKNGVSTLDLVRLQKHLLGTQLLDSPYKFIAADANNSESVSVLDLINIRKLILGLTSNFPNNESWRFVHKPYMFPDTLDPWPFPESVEYDYDGFNGNFIGVKIGDVNGSTMGGITEIHARGPEESWKLLIDDRNVKAGETIVIPVYSKAIEDILGFQFTLETKGLKYVGMQAGVLDVSSECFGIHKDAITMSWNDVVPVTFLTAGAQRPHVASSFSGGARHVVANGPLFTLQFTVATDGVLSDFLNITSGITRAEAYVAATSIAEEIEIRDVKLDFTANGFVNAQSADTLIFCTSMSNAELPASSQVYLGEGHPDASSCTLHIWSTQTVTPTCGSNVTYNVRFYPFDGIDFVQVVAATTVPLDLNQQVVLNFDTRSSSLPADHEIHLHGVPYTSGSCASVNRHHRLLWTVVNDCNETTIFEYLIRVEDCEKPRPICVGLSSVVLPSSGSVTLWARDFDSGYSVDDCTGYDDLIYSFSGNSYEPARVFDCGDILCEGPSFLFEIWIADAGIDIDCDDSIVWDERNKDFCTTFIVFDDNDNACECDSYGPYRITTIGGQGIPSVQVDFRWPNGDTVLTTFTDNEGYYDDHFVINPLLLFEIVPYKNDDPKNGVSTLDLIRIQKHLLGTQLLESPYQHIAADINNSESVSALDIVELRKLILGLTSGFPKNTSWRFIPTLYVFPDFNSPWPFPETDSAGSQLEFDGNFYGVKVGDVNGTTYLTPEEILTRQTRPVLQLHTDEHSVKQNQVIEAPIHCDGLQDLLGFQFTLQTKGLKYTGVKAGSIDVTTDCIAVHHDAITMSWASPVPATFSKTEARRRHLVSANPLFFLIFTATETGSLSEMLNLTSDITKAEAYVPSTAVTDDLKTVDIALSITENEFAGTAYALYQNVPNPFSDETTIGFSLPAALQVTLSIYDVNGDQVYNEATNFEKGYHQFLLNKREFKSPGVYSYRLSAGDFTASKKLIVLKE
ncbi:MAG TPA: T9SS type A sorting domain-containing protein [Saprospiraceae bacterium]|nr:T9SS type A sorting domain-containing protein [Saprospiraceae bacterium]